MKITGDDYDNNNSVVDDLEEEEEDAANVNEDSYTNRGAEEGGTEVVDVDDN